MQSVLEAWSAEEVDSVRKIAQGVQVAWKKDFRPGVTLFTIGSSTIGGNDIIAGPAGVQSAWNRYLYNDETDKVLSIAYERGLNLPSGGLTKAMADVVLDNTSGRYTPRYAGGNSELFTAILPRRPLIINAGFNYGGVDNTIPQFVGVTDKQAQIDIRNKTAALHAVDFIGFLQNQYVDKTAMFTTERTDVVIENLLTQAGFSTAQYDLDPGINIVKFGLFETGTRFADIIDELVKAEYGHFYQDEEGRLRFENRQHWSNYPHFNVQRVITTAQVINAVVPNTDNIINVVEVKGSPRAVTDTQLIWRATGFAGSGVVMLPAGDTEVWVNYNDPIFEVDTPQPNGTSGQTSFFIANTLSDDTGTDVTSSVYLKSIINFAQSSKLVFSNSYGSEVFLTTLDVWGRPARKTGDVYYKGKIGSSITAFEEQPFVIENQYIQDADWAVSLAELILQDFSRPENMQEITIRAIPELQFGDLISWQGHYWFIWDIKIQIDPGVGFIQTLKLLQRTIRSYMRIGISTIGGSDVISP